MAQPPVRKIVRYFFLVFLCIMVSACSGLSNQPITQSPQPARSVTPELTATQISSIIPLFTFTPVIEPTYTPTSLWSFEVYNKIRLQSLIGMETYENLC